MVARKYCNSVSQVGLCPPEYSLCAQANNGHRGKRVAQENKLKTKEEVLSILGRELPYLNERYGVGKIGLFGSYSRDEQDAGSDIDLLVQFDRPISFFKFIAVEDYLKDKLGERVEIVTADALKPVIKPRIMQECVYVQPS